MTFEPRFTLTRIEQARENIHRKHPKTRFVNAHLAMLYYDPAKVAKLLDTYPNADVEISASVQDLGRPRESAEAYEQALAIDRSLADAHYNLAGLYETLGELEAAFRHLRTYRTLTQGA